MNNNNGFSALRKRLQDPCFEIIPLKGVEKKVADIPPGSDVAITCSPDKGISATLELTELLKDHGFVLIPHIAARMVRDEDHLRLILNRLEGFGVHRIFVVGGDAEKPAGKFDSSLQILEHMSSLDHSVEIIGIGAYPEGHPLIDDSTLLQFLREKQRFAMYMVTQMCFDPEGDRELVAWRPRRGSRSTRPSRRPRCGRTSQAPANRFEDRSWAIGTISQIKSRSGRPDDGAGRV